MGPTLVQPPRSPTMCTITSPSNLKYDDEVDDEFKGELSPNEASDVEEAPDG